MLIETRHSSLGLSSILAIPAGTSFCTISTSCQTKIICLRTPCHLMTPQEFNVEDAVFKYHMYEITDAIAASTVQCPLVDFRDAYFLPLNMIEGRYEDLNGVEPKMNYLLWGKTDRVDLDVPVPLKSVLEILSDDRVL